MAEIQDTIREIKSKFRLFMNGMVSQSMREKGIDYKLNFGIEYPRIKEIAADYPCNHEPGTGFVEREHPRMQDYGRITSACRGFLSGNR